MNSELETSTGTPSEFDLGTWLGRHQAFSIVAGKASAADVECIRQIRDQKIYQLKTADWGDFCPQYLGASKSHVNSQIQYLQKYGPQYFELAQITRVTHKGYCAIADHVTNKGVELDGEVIPLATENSQRLAAAVSELRRRAGKPARKALPSGEGADVVPEIERSLRRLIILMHTLPEIEKYDDQSWTLVHLLGELRQVAKERGAPIDL